MLGHTYKLCHIAFLMLEEHYFSNIVINAWNSLPLLLILVGYFTQLSLCYRTA